MKLIRRFWLNRKVDPTGISGLGLVAQGIEFPDGQCVLFWPNYGTIGVYPQMSALIAVHGHEGATVVEWIDDPN